MPKLYRCKQLVGNNRLSIYEYEEKKALRLESAGDVQILNYEKADVPDQATCAGKTADGAPCNRQPKEGESTCWQHESREEVE